MSISSEGKRLKIAAKRKFGGKCSVYKAFKMMPYSEYLKTERWAFVKRISLKMCDNKCIACGSGKELNCHHIIYRPRGMETKHDVCILCRDCHSIFHEKISKSYLKSFKDMLKPKSGRSEMYLEVIRMLSDMINLAKTGELV